MATPPMNDGDKPVTQAQLVAELKATRADLRQEIAGVRTELVGAIHHLVETFGNRFDQMRDEMAAMRSDMAAMRNDMVTMHADLSRQIAGAARAAAEARDERLALQARLPRPPLLRWVIAGVVVAFVATGFAFLSSGKKEQLSLEKKPQPSVKPAQLRLERELRSLPQSP